MWDACDSSTVHLLTTTHPTGPYTTRYHYVQGVLGILLLLVNVTACAFCRPYVRKDLNDLDIFYVLTEAVFLCFGLLFSTLDPHSIAYDVVYYLVLVQVRDGVPLLVRKRPGRGVREKGCQSFSLSLSHPLLLLASFKFVCMAAASGVFILQDYTTSQIKNRLKATFRSSWDDKDDADHLLAAATKMGGTMGGYVDGLRGSLSGMSNGVFDLKTFTEKVSADPQVNHRTKRGLALT